MEDSNLKNVKFNSDYDSYEQDIIKDFYVPALSNATHYDRVSAFFDSKILSLYSKGIRSIAKQGGKIRFVFSHQLNEADYNKMEEGYSERALKDVINKFDADGLNDEELHRLSDLSFLISAGIVDIKIAFTREGLNHDKFGLIYDDDNDFVYFRGSNNETLAAVYRNHEIFEVSCSMWNEEHENKKIERAINSFNNIWNNNVVGRKVVEIPDVIKSQLELISNQYGYNDCIENSVVLDYSGNSLVMINNLNNVDLTKDFIFKNFIKGHIRLFDDNKYTFYHENYSMLNKRIDKITQLVDKNKAQIIITNRLRIYLENKKSYLEAKANIGTAVKINDFSRVNEFKDDLNKKYELFKLILNREMERQLRSRQLLDAFHIVCLGSSANFSVPGAGKTSIVYGAFAYMSSKEIQKVNKILMIGPISSFKSWKDEFVANFGNKRSLKVLDIQNKKYSNSSQREVALRAESGDCNLILVNYDSLNSLKDALRDIINDKVLLVFDEIHKIKAIDGVTAKAALCVAECASYKVALTGTPIPNSYQDLYNMFEIILGEDRSDYIRYDKDELKHPSPIKVNEINEKIFPFFCRTTKKDLLIPEANPDILIRCNTTQSEVDLYKMINKKFSGCSLEKYIRLLQASTNPTLLLKQINKSEIQSIMSYEDISEFTEDYDNFKYVEPKFNDKETELILSVGVASKFKASIDKILELVNAGKQVLVWGIFVDTLDKISEFLNQNSVTNSVICGRVSPGDRETIIDWFKNKKIQVLIANPHTMAESVSLHHTCHDAVYIEYSFNLTHMLQSRDRINRLGLPDNQYTQYYYMVQECDDYFLDRRTYNRLKEKEQIMLNSIENRNLKLISFSVEDDMREIFKKI